MNLDPETRRDVIAEMTDHQRRSLAHAAAIGARAKTRIAAEKVLEAQRAAEVAADLTAVLS